MAITTIPWNDGSGDNIYVSAPSQTGSQTVSVTSDANTGSTDRTQTVTFTATANGQTVTKILTVIQEKVVEQYIVFADPEVARICAETWGDGIGIKPSQAAQVTSFGSTFISNTDITSFDEQVYFTGLTSYGSNNPGTFSGCTSLVSVTIPEIPLNTSVQTYERAFQGCTALETVTLHGIISNLAGTNGPSYTFNLCSSLSRVNIDSIEKWLRNYFVLNSAMPFGASNGGRLYINNIEVTNVNIPSTVTAINPRAFLKCIGITSVTLPSLVTSIGNNAFQGCTSLTNVEIGFSCATIGANAFNNVGTTTDKCTFILRPTTPPSLASTNAFTANRINKIYVPNGTLSAYQTATIWSSYASYMAELDSNGNIPT